MSKSFADFRLGHLSAFTGDQPSGATTPGGMDWGTDNEDGKSEQEQNGRHKPRTYPYFDYLPYGVEDEATRLTGLDEILRNLYISIEAGDFAPGALHWTRELRAWLNLKFDLPRGTRAKLVKLYYELSLAPGINPSVAERFASLYSTLMKYLPLSFFHPSFAWYRFVVFCTHFSNSFTLFCCVMVLLSFKFGNTRRTILLDGEFTER